MADTDASSLLITTASSETDSIGENDIFFASDSRHSSFNKDHVK